jgi:hypothetical protein
MSVARVGRSWTALSRVASWTPRAGASPLTVRWFSEEDNPRRLGTRFIDLRSDTVTKPTPAMAIVRQSVALSAYLRVCMPHVTCS